MKNEVRLLNEIKQVFKKNCFDVLVTAIDDYLNKNISESTLEEILFEWNTRINPEYIEMEEEGRKLRSIIPLKFIKVQDTYIRPAEIISIRLDTKYDGRSNKTKYVIIFNADEDEKKILYKNLTLAYDSEQERTKELNWLKEILSFYGVTFQN